MNWLLYLLLLILTSTLTGHPIIDRVIRWSESSLPMASYIYGYYSGFL